MASAARRDTAVLLRQEIHRVVEAVEVAPRRLGEEVERLLGADREQHGIVLAFEIFRRKILADVDAAMERHALGFHLLDAPRDDGLFHLEVGNAIDEQAARPRVLLVDVDVVAGARQLLGRGKARRT